MVVSLNSRLESNKEEEEGKKGGRNLGGAALLLGLVHGRKVLVKLQKGVCEDRLGTGPPRARTEVIYVDLGCWAISGSIHPKWDPARGE